MHVQHSHIGLTRVKNSHANPDRKKRPIDKNVWNQALAIF